MRNTPGKRKPRRKAGHRSWAARGAPIPGKHHGDIMSPETRSRVMARIRGKNTGPESTVFAELRRRKTHYAKHVKNLPGRPDVVFQRARLVVFIDGDFWHGWRFPLWQHKLSAKWRNKITATRARDRRNFAKLRLLGWRVMRVWEHQVESSPHECVDRILAVREECLNELTSGNDADGVSMRCKSRGNLRRRHRTTVCC